MFNDEVLTDEAIDLLQECLEVYQAQQIATPKNSIARGVVDGSWSSTPKKIEAVLNYINKLQR